MRTMWFAAGLTTGIVAHLAAAPRIEHTAYLEGLRRHETETTVVLDEIEREVVGRYRCIEGRAEDVRRAAWGPRKQVDVRVRDPYRRH